MKPMDILVLTDAQGGTARLTTYSPLSHYGCPVLRIEADDISGDFGPGDIIGEAPKLMVVRDFVLTWAQQPERTKEELAAARKFLCQSPDYQGQV